MINTTNGQLVFAETKNILHFDIVRAMENSAEALLKLHDLEDLDLTTVTTKTNTIAAYAKFVRLHILHQNVYFDEAYLESVWDFYKTGASVITPEQYYAATLGTPNTDYEFKRSYCKALKQGFGLFLVTLHGQGTITLPIRFDWPPHLAKAGRVSEELGIFSELLGFLRLLHRDSEELPHPAFKSVDTNIKRREWFLCYATKLLLATGWLTPEEASLEDLLTIRKEVLLWDTTDVVNVYKQLIDVLRARYGESFNITVEAWTSAIRSSHVTSHKLENLFSMRIEGNSQNKCPRDDADLLNDVVKATPIIASPEALRSRPRLPGLTTDLHPLTSKWLGLEEVYLRTLNRENYKPVIAALGYLNIYLFFYLPYWFQRYADSSLEFPDVPRKLTSSLFIARLLDTKENVPFTFIDYMEARQRHKKWGNNGYYGILKQVEIFFKFLEENSDSLPECNGFRQPIPEYVYPETSRSKGTNKRPIPRRVFSIFLDYIEALRTHLAVVLEGALSGKLDVSELELYLLRGGGNFIDTFATASLVGFVPVIFSRGRTIPLRYIPNCLALDYFPVADGKLVKLPQPHSLNQILVALYTGLRHNHIQWLDARKFDADVTDDNNEFSYLHVNTDKMKKSPWSPHVNFHVIEVLRNQREWRQLVQWPGFAELCYYNNNPKTKWPPILPLFSSGKTGLPHPDSRYTSDWQDIVSAVDALLQTLGEKSLQRLSSLEIPGVTMDDPASVPKRIAYGATCKRVCELGVKSLITPHSARVTVVSQYSTLLPAEIIGSRITGQSPGQVYYYVVIDEEDVLTAEAHQAMKLRERAYRNEFESLVTGKEGSSNYIRADDINSNFAQSLRSNLQETLLSYGCVSITLNEDATSGLDVLRVTRAANAAENKTEICPYGNNCPPEIIKQWEGPHRCGLCQYAVRSIDHLPAVCAKVKEFKEILDDLTVKVEAALRCVPPPYTDEELDRLDKERSRIAEELTGWQLCVEVLDTARHRIAQGQDTRRWLVQKPEIILKDLKRVEAPSNLTAYVLLRLGECLTYPTCESPQIRARFDVVRRELLARSGQIRKAFDLAGSTDPASECAGLLRTVVEANKLSYDDVINLIGSDDHLNRLPLLENHLLLEGE